jgi:hypothetical protein
MAWSVEDKKTIIKKEKPFSKENNFFYNFMASGVGFSLSLSFKRGEVGGI